MNEEQKYNELRKRLRSLPRIRAGKDFENTLLRRIQHEKGRGVAAERDRRGWLSNLLKQPMFAPAVGLTSLVIVGLIIYVAFFTETKQTNTNVSQDVAVKKEYSATQLETLKTKVGKLQTERPKEFATTQDLTVEQPKPMREVITDFRSRTEGDIIEGKRTEDAPKDKTGEFEKMEEKVDKKVESIDKIEKLEKKEAPPSSSEEKGKVDEILRQGVISNQNANMEQQQDTSDSTKTIITGKNKKAKKKKD